MPRPLALWGRDLPANKWALLALILAGVIGLIASFILHRSLQRDWQALLKHHGYQTKDEA